jgi:enamine deaminase RidA (YjgF/YER057c/UK114 family)
MTGQAGPEERLRQLGITLPDLAPAAAAPNPYGANNVPVVRSGNLLFFSGNVGTGPNGERISGKLGGTVTIEEGYAAARQAAIRLLARIRQETGSLDRVRRVVKVLAFVNSMPDFTDQPRVANVANGASDLFTEVFGENGRHARSAVGVVSLPGGAPIEVEMVVEVAES